MIAKIQYLDNYNIEQWREFKHQRDGDAGFDLRAAIDKPIKLLSPFFSLNYISLVPCGFKIELPQSYEMQIRPRSGLAAKYGITVLNSPGTVDSGFRGEVRVILINLSHSDFIINPGDRIAQAVMQKTPEITLQRVENINETERNEQGFGSSGIK